MNFKYNTAMLPWTDILIALEWYITVFILGFLGWVILLPYANKLPGTGYALGRAVGLVLIGSLTWMLSVLHIFDFTLQNIWLIVLFGFAFVWKRRVNVLRTLKENWKEIFISEVATIVFFLIAILMKSNKPGITDIEKFMDSAFIGAAIRTTSGVPLDPWYSGSTINYYYLGHWFMATIAKMTSTAPNYAFNLAYSTVMMLAGSNIFLAGWTLSKKKMGGILSGFLVLLSSNLHPLLAKIHNVQNYFFFSSGRFIQEVINEYPLNSFIVGDVHAHTMSLILTTTFILCSIVAYKLEKLNYIVIAFIGLLIGLMSAVNAFDVVNYGLFSGVALLFLWLRHRPKIETGVRILSVFVFSALVPFVIFKSSFVAPVGGIGFTFWETPASHIFMQFGLFFYLIFAFTVAGVFLFRRKIVFIYKNRKSLASIKNFLEFLENISAETFILSLLVFTGLCLVILPQFVFIKDIYFTQNPPYARANTVFKIWYEAWVMLALSSGVCATILYSWLANRYSLKGKFFASAIISVTLMIGGYGLLVGLDTMKDVLPNTLDGIDFTKRLDGPQDYEVVEWARKNISGQPLVLEGTGQSYTTYDWFSAYTGLPTIIGWESHEWGWRYNKDAWNKVAERMGVVEGVYKTKDPEELRSKAHLIGISYILVSPNEVRLYGADNSIMKKAFGRPVFDNGKAALYNTGFVGKNIYSVNPGYK